MDNLKERIEAAFSTIAEDETKLYLHQPIPCGLDSKISRLVHLFMDSTISERSYFFQSLDEDFSWLLITYAERMAALAVRERSRDRILEGLSALIIEDYSTDWRDNLTRLAVLYDAATRIGVSPEEVFTEAASLADNSVARNLTDFLTRTQSERSLEAFLFKVTDEPDGFRYTRWFPWRT